MFNKKQKNKFLLVSLLCILSCPFISSNDLNAESLYFSSFENDFDNFESRYGSTISISQQNAYAGSSSIFVSDRTSSWQGICLSSDSYLKSGNTYSIKSKVFHTNSTSQNIKLTLQYTDSLGSVNYNQISLSNVEGNKWTEISNENYTVPLDAKNLVIYFETVDNTIDFYIDDFSIDGFSVSSLKGDLDKNNKIDSNDIVLLNNYLNAENDNATLNADMNSDGLINVYDLSLLRQNLINSTLNPPVIENPWDKYVENADKDRLEIYKNSLYQMGNTYRLRNKISTAQNGQPTTVAYIGGSITEGGGSNTCYAYRSYKYFADTFGTGNNVNYINAGMSGTSSVVGNLRAQDDILNKNPDVIFIEFSVNDHPEEIYKKSFESLVKKCLDQKNEPAVIIIINRSKGGYSQQTQMAAIGKNYNVPIISMDNALTIAFKAGKMTWEDYGSDEYHPHDKGSLLISDCIGYFYRQAMKTENQSTDYVIPQSIVYGTEYSTATLVSQSSLQNFSNGSFSLGTTHNKYKNGWTFSKNSNNQPLKFTTTGKGVFVLFKSNQNSSLGVLNVTVNGKTKQIAGNRNYAWGGPDADIAYIQTDKGTLDVSMSMQSSSTDFVIYGIGIIN